MKNDPQEIASMIDLCEHVNDPRGGNYTEICRQWDRECRPPPAFAWKDAVLWLLLCAVGAGAAWAWRVF